MSEVTDLQQLSRKYLGLFLKLGGGTLSKVKQHV
jgi:hypothetical protein